MGAPLDLVPGNQALVDEHGTIEGIWFRWFFALWTRIKSNVQVVGTPIRKTAQNAALPPFTVYAVTQTGDYRVSWTARITTADGVNSSVGVTIGWRTGGNTCSKTFAALTGDTTTTADGNQLLVRADSRTVITGSTSYSSNKPAKMQYELDIVPEFVN